MNGKKLYEVMEEVKEAMNTYWGPDSAGRMRLARGIVNRQETLLKAKRDMMAFMREVKMERVGGDLFKESISYDTDRDEELVKRGREHLETMELINLLTELERSDLLEAIKEGLKWDIFNGDSEPLELVRSVMDAQMEDPESFLGDSLRSYLGCLRAGSAWRLRATKG